MKAHSQHPVESTTRRLTVGGLNLSGILLVAILCSTVNAQPPSLPGPAKKKSAPAKKKKTKQPKRKPVNVLPEMEITKELITDAEYDELGRVLNGGKVPGQQAIRIQRILANGENKPEAIKKWVKWRLFGMTLKSKRDSEEKPNLLSDMRRDLLTDIRNAARNIRNAPAARRAYRNMICKVVTDHCAKLMDNNYHVRMQAILILRQMNLLEATREAAVAYGPAADVLMDEVIKKNQHVSLKIAAVNALKRIAILTNPSNVDMNRKMAALLISELEKRETHQWYQLRLATTLGSIDLEAAPNGDAIIAQALLVTVADGSRHLTVRCEAAKSLGRAAIPKSVNADLIAYEIVSLCRKVAESYNADIEAYKAALIKHRRMLAAAGMKWDPVNAPKMAVHHPAASFNLYLAFRPYDRFEENLYANRRFDRKVGLLAKFPGNALIKGANAEVKVVTSHLLKQIKVDSPTPIPDTTIDRLAKWLGNTANQPKSPRLHPGLKAIGGMKAAANAKVGNATGGVSVTTP